MTPNLNEGQGFCMPTMSRVAQALLLLGATSLAWGQSEDGGADRRGLSIKPTLSMSGTLTDNIGLNGGPKDKAVIGMVSPGLTVRSNTGTLRGSLDYSMDGLMYYRTSYADRVQHRLQSQASAALLEGRFLIDMRATVGQQARSALGAEQSVSPYLSNANQSQMASLTIAPRLRGVLAGLANYDASISGSETRVKDSTVGDGRSAQASFNLEGMGGVERIINWNLSAQASRATGSGQARKTSTDSAMLGLRYRPDMDLGLNLQAGKERSNFITLDQVTSNTYSLGADWTPTERTTLNAEWRRHNYGNAHSLNFSHRMSRSSWRYSDSQGVNGPGAVGGGTRQTNYALYDSIFTAQESDPVKRDLMVRAFLLSSGLSADAIANSGFLSGAASLTRSQTGAFSLLGQRSTATLTLSQAKTRRLDPFSTVNDDLSSGGVLRQRSGALSLSHKLSQTNSVSLTVADQKTDSSGSGQSTDLKTLLGSFNGQLGRRLSYSFSLRHARFNSDVKSYRENAVTATLTQQFQ
ncbi:TIGR03016 family PEP-CTERM system-associated outer membrane protein [Roseateles microcysteis]|uniref:TIGR03016 family PEP-CTERM system-associated outer membrane protein n=1 Tax=Roseateles microcysteis TaxID=3119057 RepID=UPI002FE50649